MITYATDENFHELIAEGPVVVDFFGKTCVPCKMIARVLESLDDEFPFLNIVKVDTDECSKVSREYKIFGIPDLYFYKDGKLISREMGAVTEDVLREHLVKILYA